MIKQIVSFSFLALCVLNAHSATWFLFRNAISDDGLYFFDGDTVEKNENSKTIWIKNIKNKNLIIKNKTYSEVIKYSVYCEKRKIQTLSAAFYDKKDNPIGMIPELNDLYDIIPGTIFEKMFKVICSADFPMNPSLNFTGNAYSRVSENNPYKFTEEFFEIMRPKKIRKQPRDVFKELGIDPNSVKPQGRDLFEELGIDPKAPMPKEKSSTK